MLVYLGLILVFSQRSPWGLPRVYFRVYLVFYARIYPGLYPKPQVYRKVYANPKPQLFTLASIFLIL